MPYAVSADGTRIAYDATGHGPALVIVGGALSDRRFSKFVKLAELLAGDFTAINYDRRGRGDSGDAPPYAIEREIEDLTAVIEAVGGRASVLGFSSGAVLTARAAAAGAPIDQLAPFAGFGEYELLPDACRQGRGLLLRIVRNHPLVDGKQAHGIRRDGRVHRA